MSQYFVRQAPKLRKDFCQPHVGHVDSRWRNLLSVVILRRPAGSLRVEPRGLFSNDRPCAHSSFEVTSGGLRCRVLHLQMGVVFRAPKVSRLFDRGSCSKFASAAAVCSACPNHMSRFRVLSERGYSWLYLPASACRFATCTPAVGLQELSLVDACSDVSSAVAAAAAALRPRQQLPCKICPRAG